jgi:hypothetical protein
MPPSLRLTAARHALGLLRSEDLVRAADETLAGGVYSYSLGELATSVYPWTGAGPLFLSALRELGIVPPDREEALSILTRHHVGRVWEAADPRDALGRFMDDFYRPLMWGPHAARPARLADLEGLVGWGHEYRHWDSFPDAYVDPARRDETLADLERLARDFAARWLRKRGPIDLDRACLGAVLAVARGIAAEGAYDRLAVLADALEEAGCADLDLLDHCRHPEEHAGRCWVVDRLLEGPEP